MHAPSSRIASSGNRLLALRRSIDIRRFVALEDEGWHVATVASLGSARQVIASSHPQLLVLDLTLRDEFGATLLEELARRNDAPATVDAAFARPTIRRNTFHSAAMHRTANRRARSELRPAE